MRQDIELIEAALRRMWDDLPAGGEIKTALLGIDGSVSVNLIEVVPGYFAGDAESGKGLFKFFVHTTDGPPQYYRLFAHCVWQQRVLIVARWVVLTSYEEIITLRR